MSNGDVIDVQPVETYSSKSDVIDVHSPENYTCNSDDIYDQPVET